MNYTKIYLPSLLITGFLFMVGYSRPPEDPTEITQRKEGFRNPPDSARPGVYWYFMDGNLSKTAMTADLESMKAAGIGNLVFLEVNVGIPRGKVNFLSEEWQDLFAHAVHEAERLGIAITLGVGPGWTGSGGPWVPAVDSMKHLVTTRREVSGGGNQTILLPRPAPMKPYFGERGFTPELKKQWQDYYEDVAVLAFPTPSDNFKIKDVEEKALYYRAPYTSVKGVKPFLPSMAKYQEPPKGAVIAKDGIVDVTRFLKADGTLEWKVPEGNWTILRLGSRNNGAVTRPAPLPGVGFEADKFDPGSLQAHLDHFTGKLLRKTGLPDGQKAGGLKMLHMDSWEMGAQNWSQRFREEFSKRRGYDPLPHFPVYAGLVVESLEQSERFLWDLRQTAQELIIENHARYLKSYGRKFDLGLSIEPYDMNPTADMELGAVADVPMCEFWSKDFGFNSAFSCIQAASIAHVEGKKVVAAEAFTAHKDAWKQYPGSMKNQGDWAFASGVNRLVYHTFQHQFLNEDLKPGMTMGPYGVHHDRSQTWWPMAISYHRYIARCQYMLQQGAPVADILFLTPEGSPHVFRAPDSAFTGDEVLPDRKGYNFDGCSPSQLLTATVHNQQVVFPSGAHYRLLVLPAVETMTPALLDQIGSLVKAGAILVGNPPQKSPSLANFPLCDTLLVEKAKRIWGGTIPPGEISERPYGKGRIIWGGRLAKINRPDLYPDYDSLASLFRRMKIPEDFESNGAIRYFHLLHKLGDVYFVSNKTNASVDTVCTFRTQNENPELWDPLLGESRRLPDFKNQDRQIRIPLQFAPYQSYFVVFSQKGRAASVQASEKSNFPERKVLAELNGPWAVSFDPKWGGPQSALFPQLEDWTKNQTEGIKYYSGTATYHRTIHLPEDVRRKNPDLSIDLGEVHHLARIYVNGREVGIVWTAPFQANISDAVVPGDNRIDIEVANLWPNRLIGDEQYPDDGIKNGQWPEWLLKNQARTSGRFTFTTAKFYQKDSALLKSGLIGPVRIITQNKKD
jgi:hypothetical protein